MKNYDYYFRRSTSCGQLLALRVSPAAPQLRLPRSASVLAYPRISSFDPRCTALHKSQQTLWLEAVLNPLVKNLTCKEIYKSGYRVCYLHFREQDYVCGPRNVFKKKIVPSVLLPKKDGNGLTLSYNLKN